MEISSTISCSLTTIHIPLYFPPRAVRLLYGMGLVVEPSGAASVAAVLSKKVPDIAGKKVVAFVTGGNVSPHELQEKCGITI